LPDMKILVIDDEKKIAEIAKAYLERDGYTVVVGYDGKAALELFQKEHTDLLVLDLMLPEINGWDVCRQLRKESDVPIIMLTARDDTTDIIVGLELGVSRVRAVLRRYEGRPAASHAITSGKLHIDLDRRTVRRGGANIDLTSTEFDLLRIMAESPGRVYTRMQLLDMIQGEAYEGYERTIDSHIKNLRKKIEPDPNHPVYIITIHGTGYKMEENLDA
jgi:two-component system OmpR family response regulator